MSKQIKFSKTKGLAIVLAVMLLLSSVSAAVVGAETANAFTVTLTDGSDVIALDDVSVTITNKQDEEKTATVKTVEGQAVFGDFVSSGTTYVVIVDEVSGYEKADSLEFTATDDISGVEVELVALQKTTVKGTVKDEDGNLCSDVTIEYDGYTKGNVKTDKDGQYSFEAYVGKAYSVLATAEKYVTAIIEIDSVTDNLLCEDFVLDVKTFTINGIVDANATIEPESLTVKYGESASFKITANEGYRIEKIDYNGESVAPEDAIEYVLDIEGIVNDFDVSATTYRKAYKINISYNENGKVYEAEYDEDGNIVDVDESKIVTDGGSISFNEGELSGFVAVSDENYHISSIVIDGEKKELTYDNNLTEYEHTFDTEKDWNVEVEFSVNCYTISLASTVHGRVSVADDKVLHGEDSARIFAEAEEEYFIEKIVIKSVAYPDGITISDSDSELYEITVDETGKMSWIIPDVMCDTTVEVIFSEIPTSDDTIDELIEIEAKKGTLLERKTDDDGNYVYVFSADSTAKITPKSPYKKIIINGIYGKSREFYSSTSISKVKLSKGIFNGSVSMDLGGKSIIIVIDETMPQVADITPMDIWSENIYTIKGKVWDVPGKNDNDITSGVSHVVWSKGESLDEDEILNATEENIVEVTQEGTYSFDVQGEHDNVRYYVYAVDKAGNCSKAKTVDVKIDITDPEVTSFNFEKQDSSVIEDVINFFTFGTLFQETIDVRIGFVDKNVSSGINKIILYSEANDEEAELTQVGIIVFDKDGKIVESESENFDYDKTRSDTAVFKVTEEYFNNTKISAKVVDYSGRESKVTRPTEVETQAKSDIVIVDATPAEITLSLPEADYVDIDNKRWYAGDFDFNVDISAKNYIGINSIVVKINGTAIEKDISEAELVVSQKYSAEVEKEEGVMENTLTEKLSFKFSTSQFILDETTAQSGEYNIEIDVKTNTTVTSIKSEKIYIDRTNPDIVEFEIKPVNDSSPSEVINYLTFGIFCNEKLKVKVSAEDSNASSGTASITLYADEEVFGTSEADEDGTATFEVPIGEVTDNEKHFAKSISAKAVDNVRHETSEFVTPTTLNSDIYKSSFLMIETVAPTATITTEDAVYTDEQGALWYNSNVPMTVNVADVDSGIRTVDIIINDTPITNDVNDKQIDRDFSETAVYEEEFVINTSQSTRNEDGSYIVTVTVVDNAGNALVSEKTVYVDDSAPYIIGFDFAPETYVEGSETEVTVEETDYGFYFIEDTTVTIFAKDDEPSSGIRFITYYTVDIDSGKSEEQSFAVDENDSLDVVIPADFKGQIFAKATDNVYNAVDDFVNPNSTIVESPEKHAAEEHIEFAKAETTFATPAGSELYAESVPVTITVIDTYSGIRSIDWTVVAPYDVDNNQEGNVVIGNNGAVASGDSDWQIVETEKNLVTKIQKTITVSNNSNDIVVHVAMMDRAGNESEKEIQFSIDTTAPEITIVYDNNTPDSVYDYIYLADRTATITIRERNFNAADVVTSITNTDGVIPSVSSWAEHLDTTNPDDSYYEATVAYTSDGDYTFDISYTDLAGNEANQVETHQFTIDKTLPIISVSYDNNAALNGNYYRADRTATVTINEHNFDASRVEVIGEATNEGASVAFPVESAWSTSGDVHSATIYYSADAVYNFDITFKDMAGNEAMDYVPEQFVVDKTAPALEITGVADMSANADVVAPVVTYTDTNFDIGGVTITLVGANNGNVNYPGAFSDVENGQSFVFANFEKVQSVDDLYSLTATVSDLAGNTTTQTIRFSANRFGSVYTFDQSLIEISEKYINTERDIVFVETNVDALAADTIKVKLVRNGTPQDLVVDKDYTIEMTGGNGAWSQYRYVVNKSLLASDGRYSISIYSVDAAGNINQNTDETKKAEISFGVDKTSPVIVPVDFQSSESYAVEKKIVNVEIKDNLVLDDVKIYLNGTAIEYSKDADMFTFEVPEMNDEQNVRILAVDAAGNEKEIIVEDFIVSSSAFVRWYNNTPLFIGSIAGTAGLLIAAVAIILVVAKKKREE